MTTHTPDDVLNDEQKEEFVKDALTQTSILTFIACGMRHYHRFEMGLKIPPNSAIAFGSCTHKTSEHNMRQKKETHEDLPTADLQDFFVNEFEDYEENIEWTAEERAVTIPKTRDALIKTGRGCVGAYQEAVAWRIQPTAVEKPYRIKFNNDIPYDLASRGIDLIGEVIQDDEEQSVMFRPEGEVIFDLKTASKKPPATKADNSFQLTLNAIAYRTMTGKLERGLQLDHVVKTKTPYVFRQPTIRSDNQLQAALVLIGRVIQSIEHAKRTGAFLPADPDWWGCSEKWCGYWNLCEFGGKK